MVINVSTFKMAYIRAILQGYAKIYCDRQLLKVWVRGDASCSGTIIKEFYMNAVGATSDVKLLFFPRVHNKFSFEDGRH